MAASNKRAEKQAAVNKPMTKRAKAKKAADQKPKKKKPAAQNKPTDKRAAAEKSAAKKSVAPSQVRDAVLATLRAVMPDWVKLPTTTEKLLRFEPNTIDDADPSMFYDALSSQFGIELQHGGGFGGTIGDTIAFVAKRWNGKKIHPVEGLPRASLDGLIRGTEVLANPGDPVEFAKATGVLWECTDGAAAKAIWSAPEALACADKLIALAPRFALEDRSMELGVCAELTLAIRRAQLPADSLEMAYALRVHALWKLHRGDRPVARKELDAAIKILTKLLGADHEDTANTRVLRRDAK